MRVKARFGAVVVVAVLASLVGCEDKDAHWEYADSSFSAELPPHPAITGVKAPDELSIGLAAWGSAEAGLARLDTAWEVGDRLVLLGAAVLGKQSTELVADTATGAVQWRLGYDGATLLEPGTYLHVDEAAVAEDPGLVLVPYRASDCPPQAGGCPEHHALDGKYTGLVALSVDDGSLVWMSSAWTPSTHADLRLAHVMVVDGMAVYTVGPSDFLVGVQMLADDALLRTVAVDLATGQEKWHADATIAKAAANGLVLAWDHSQTSSSFGVPVALDVHTGEKKWSLGEAFADVDTVSVASDGLIYRRVSGAGPAVVRPPSVVSPVDGKVIAELSEFFYPTTNDPDEPLAWVESRDGHTRQWLCSLQAGEPRCTARALDEAISSLDLQRSSDVIVVPLLDVNSEKPSSRPYGLDGTKAGAVIPGDVELVSDKIVVSSLYDDGFTVYPRTS